jgi:hypothetical protein
MFRGNCLFMINKMIKRMNFIRINSMWVIYIKNEILRLNLYI